MLYIFFLCDSSSDVLGRTPFFLSGRPPFCPGVPKISRSHGQTWINMGVDAGGCRRDHSKASVRCEDVDHPTSPWTSGGKRPTAILCTPGPSMARANMTRQDGAALYERSGKAACLGKKRRASFEREHAHKCTNCLCLY